MALRFALPEQTHPTIDMAPQTAAYVGMAAVPSVAEAATSAEARAEAFKQTLATAPSSVQHTYSAYLGHMTHTLFGSQTSLTRAKLPTEQWGPWLATYATLDELDRLATLHAQNVLAPNQDPTVQDVLRTRREWHIDRLRDGVRQGWFSPSRTPLAIQRIQESTVTIGDPLADDYLLSGAKGYWLRGGTEVVINPALNAPPKDRRRRLMDLLRGSTVLHELAHCGFSERTDEALLPTWFEETGTEDSVQVVNALANGQDPGLLYPSRHSSTDLRRSYTQGRLVRFAMLNHGPREVDTKKYMRAWSSEGMGSPEMNDFEADLDRAWGVRNVFGRINRRMEEVERLLQIRYSSRPGYTNKNEAARQVAYELEKEPWQVFGRGYKRPNRQVGGMALSGVSK